jgi:hypothetical protein
VQIIRSDHAQALATSPELAPSFFTLLFKRANSGSVVRFLTEKSNLLDDLQVVGALLKPDLLRMILRLLLDPPADHHRLFSPSWPPLLVLSALATPPRPFLEGPLLV